MKELQVSLYEVFGYLIPGLVASCASLIVYWTFFISVPFTWGSYDGGLWWLALLVVYLVGHLVQSLANIILVRRSNISLVLEPGSSSSMPEQVLDEARKLAKSLIWPSFTADLTPSSLYELCDAYVQQKGVCDSREIYLYREGFYRGLSTATALLAVAILLRIFCAKSEVFFGEFHHALSRPELGFLAIASAGSSWLFFRRFRRFGRYLVTHGIYTALVLRASSQHPSSTPRE